MDCQLFFRTRIPPSLKGVLVVDSSNRLPFCDFLTGGLPFPPQVQSASGWDVGKMGPRKETGIPVILGTAAVGL